jgi:hypothetical protein
MDTTWVSEHYSSDSACEKKIFHYINSDNVVPNMNYLSEHLYDIWKSVTMAIQINSLEL